MRHAQLVSKLGADWLAVKRNGPTQERAGQDEMRALAGDWCKGHVVGARSLRGQDTSQYEDDGVQQNFFPHKLCFSTPVRLYRHTLTALSSPARRVPKAGYRDVAGLCGPGGKKIPRSHGHNPSLTPSTPRSTDTNDWVHSQSMHTDHLPHVHTHACTNTHTMLTRQCQRSNTEPRRDSWRRVTEGE